MARRIFLALDIDDAVRAHLASVMDRLECPEAKVRWVDPANIHVTIKFLGDIEESMIGQLCRHVEKTATAVGPFEFTVAGVLCVPPAGRLRMIWTGIEDPTGRMAELHSALDENLRPLGFEPERRGFRPHLTLARIKWRGSGDQLRRRAAEFEAEDFGTIRAEQVVVYASKLTPAGPIYSPLERSRLGPR